MLLMLFERPGENDVQVGETEVESPQNVVHEPLERLGGVAQSDGREGELEYAECSGNGLLYIVGMDGISYAVTRSILEKLKERISWWE
jgi:hypothetical protein